MRPLTSLTNRIFLACSLLATVSLGFAVYYVNARATAEAEAELRRGLLEAGTLVDQHRATLTDTFTRLARLVADLPRLKAAVETGDSPTVQPLAEEYRAQVNADLLLLTGRSGQLLGAAGVDASALDIGAAAGHAETSTFLPHARGLLQVIAVPILIGPPPSEILGRLTVGFFLDDRLARQFKDLTGSEIAFGAHGAVLASTLPASARPRLAEIADRRGTTSIVLDGEEFIGMSNPLSAGALDEAPVAIVLRSRTERLQFLTTIRTGLIGTLIVTVLFATLLSYAVARTVTRPIAAIASAMRDVAATGDLTRKVPLHSRTWDDEDARLLATAFNTLTDSIARFQREAAQKERLSSLGRLSTVVAHEIRNPLMIIKTSLRSLRRDGATADDIREAVADIDDEATRLNRIVSEVLDFAKPIRFEYAEADLNEICRASVEAACAGDTPAEVVFEPDPTLPRIVTDAERLRMALVNIVTNARHAVGALTAAPTGSVMVAVADPARVTVRTGPADGGRVYVAVTDRGTGISPDHMPHIFDPFFTTRRAGTGLGLPIARNIIDGLGGSITAVSRAGAGTDVRIELPAVPPNGAAA